MAQRRGRRGLQGRGRWHGADVKFVAVQHRMACGRRRQPFVRRPGVMRKPWHEKHRQEAGWHQSRSSWAARPRPAHRGAAILDDDEDFASACRKLDCTLSVEISHDACESPDRHGTALHSQAQGALHLRRSGGARRTGRGHGWPLSAAGIVWLKLEHALLRALRHCRRRYYRRRAPAAIAPCSRLKREGSPHTYLKPGFNARAMRQTLRLVLLLWPSLLVMRVAMSWARR